MTRDAMVEVDIAFVQMQEILKYVDYNLVNKIPEKIRNFIIGYKSFINFEFQYDMEKPLNEQNLSKDTKNLIAYFDYYYWADGDGKKVIQEAWERNEQINKIEEINGQEVSNVQEAITAEPVEQDSQVQAITSQITESTVPEASLESNASIQETTEESTDMVVRKENFFTRLINRIKGLFKKKD